MLRFSLGITGGGNSGNFPQPCLVSNSCVQPGAVTRRGLPGVCEVPEIICKASCEQMCLFLGRGSTAFIRFFKESVSHKRMRTSPTKPRPRCNGSLADPLWGLFQIEPLPASSMTLTMQFNNINNNSYHVLNAYSSRVLDIYYLI